MPECYNIRKVNSVAHYFSTSITQTMPYAIRMYKAFKKNVQEPAKKVHFNTLFFKKKHEQSK